MQLEKRAKVLQTIRTTELDMLVVGGGVTGAGIAWDAALRGLKVALVEKGDFACGTSSRSSKLIHAGLRYVSQGEFGLVRSASKERRYLLDNAGHHVTPLAFLIPSYAGEKPSRRKVRLGLLIYDMLASFKNYRSHFSVSKGRVTGLVPGIRTENLLGGLIYYDAKMDDARLTIQVIRAAEDAGAACVNYAEVVGFLKSNGKVLGARVVDLSTGDGMDIRAEIVILAAGAWTDQLLLLDDPSHVPVLRPTKGVHITVPRIIPPDGEIGDLALVSKGPDDRVTFIVPWGDYSLVGTTDTDFDRPPEEAIPTEEDIDYVIASANRFIPGAVSREDVLSAYAGVRPLVGRLSTGGEKSESEVSRTHEIGETASGILFIVGGKYTTFRTMAKEVVDKAIRTFGKNPRQFRSMTAREKLSGPAGILRSALEAGFSEEVSKRILIDYGRKTMEFLELATTLDRGSEHLGSSLYVRADIRYAVEEELALHLTDLMMRRTQLFLRPGQGLDLAKPVAIEMGNLLSWTSDKVLEEMEAFRRDLGMIFSSA